MPGVRWTASGAVTLPETLQVRWSPAYQGRLAVGAPVPGRSLTVDELDANLRWFTDPGPRGRPVSGLVLSGLPEEAGALAGPVAEARGRSVRRVVAHVDGAAFEAARGALGGLVDAWVAVARAPEEVVAGADVVIPLEEEVLARLPAMAERAKGAARVVFTWPYPRGEGYAPPDAGRAAAAVAGVVAGLGRWHLKGMPACAAGPLREAAAGTSARSGNRWYVDAEHQRQGALLFQPDVLRLAKREVCRFCALDPRCDGAPEGWLRAGVVPRFEVFR